MYKNIKSRHQSKTFTVASGTKHLSVDLTLLNGAGDVVAVAIEPLSTLPAGNAINASIRDNGGRIEDPTVIQNWQQRSGGSYKESMKPVSIPGNQTIKFELEASNNLAADFTGQIILLLEKEC